MHDPSVVDGGTTTRREVVVGGLAAGAVLAGARLFTPESAFGATLDWKYTDDRNKKIVLPNRPKRIVAYVDAAAALFGYGITPVGVFGVTPKQDPNLKSLPWNKVQEVGTVYGEIELEKLAALKPDLIVSVWYPPPLDAVPFGFKDAAHLATVGQIAPVLAVNAHVIATRGIAKFGRLSVALGANLKSAKLVKAKADFDRALGLVKTAAARKPNLRLLAMSWFGSTLYIARPRDHADLSLYRSLGANVIVPDTTSSYYEVLSLEQAGKYPHDVLMYDSRPFAPPREDFLKVPAINALPSVRAGQVVPWYIGPPLDYGNYAKQMVSFAGVLRSAREL